MVDQWKIEKIVQRCQEAGIKIAKEQGYGFFWHWCRLAEIRVSYNSSLAITSLCITILHFVSIILALEPDKSGAQLGLYYLHDSHSNEVQPSQIKWLQEWMKRQNASLPPLSDETIVKLTVEQANDFIELMIAYYLHCQKLSDSLLEGPR